MFNDGADPAAHLARQKRLKALKINGNGAGTPLAMQAQTWRTPTSLSFKDSHEPGNSRNQNENERLAEGLLSRMWVTPSVAASEGGQTSRSGARADEPLLGGQSEAVTRKTWPTPVVLDSTETANATATRSNPNSKHHSGTTLVDAIRQFSHLGQTPSTDGAPSLPSAPTSPRRRLNPIFVSWLMGWDVPAPTNSGFAEMAWSRSSLATPSEPSCTGSQTDARPTSTPSAFAHRSGDGEALSPVRGVLPQDGFYALGSPGWYRLMRSALSRIASPPAAPLAQRDLFG